MYEDNLLAGRGLRLLFVSELLSLISSLMGESLLGGILFLVSTVMSIGALNVAAPSHPYFGRAFWVNIVSLVLNGLVLFVGAYQWTGLVAVLSVVILALGVYYVYLVCTAAGQLLTVNGYATLADKGSTVWKIYLGCAIALCCFAVMALVPFLLAVAGVAVVGTLIATLVGGILYLIFLNNAYHAFLGPADY